MASSVDSRAKIAIMMRGWRWDPAITLMSVMPFSDFQGTQSMAWFIFYSQGRGCMSGESWGMSVWLITLSWPVWRRCEIQVKKRVDHTLPPSSTSCRNSFRLLKLSLTSSSTCSSIMLLIIWMILFIEHQINQNGNYLRVALFLNYFILKIVLGFIMAIKRTDSVIFEKEKQSEEKKERESKRVTFSVQNDVAAQSAASLGHQSHQQRLRVPAALQSTLRSSIKNTGSKKQIEKKSKLGGMMRSTLIDISKKVKDRAVCQICEGEVKKGKKKNKNMYICQCEHMYNFCQSCLHHYVIYKVNNFEEVNCPHEECPGVMDMTTNFFKTLPADIQQKYKKISQFQMVSKDPNAKLCPQQHCEGVVRATNETLADNILICNTCRKQFCGKCLLGVHEGDCDKEELLFMENNLHYRQCKKCNFVIEKNQGCNHITCRCKYQFCYVCGQKWTSAHYGNHDQNGRLLAVPDPGANGNQVNNDDDCCDDCCQGCCCDCDCDCDCIEDDGCCATICKCILRVLLFPLFVIAMILVFIVRDLMVMLSLFFVSLLAGMFGFSCQTVCDLEGVLCILGVIFFPVFIIVGIGLAFKEIFCETMGELCEDYCDMWRNGIESICDM